MTSSEKLLLGSVQDTTSEICRVLVNMWATGVEAGLDEKYWVRRTSDGFGVLGQQWREQLEQLVEWLDWHMWVRCRPACGDEVSVIWFIVCTALIDIFGMNVGNVLYAYLAILWRTSSRSGRQQT